MRRRFLLAAVVVLGVLASVCAGPASIIPAAEKKMRPEELVARHLESIGTAAALAAAKNRVMNGAAEVTFRLGAQGHLFGKGAILSEGNKYCLEMNFPHEQYLGERIAYNGQNVTAGTVRSGVRTNLASFLYNYDFLLKEGLVGGTTSLGWFLLDVAGRQPKLEYGRLKSVDGKKLHELRYKGGKGAGTFQTFFYFDPVTFQHMLSLYSLRVPAHLAKTMPSLTQDQLEGFYRLREEFGAFKTVDGLTLPHFYKLVLTVEGQDQTFLANWSISISQVLHNQKLDAGSFNEK
jgi:hypothetical protein